MDLGLAILGGILIGGAGLLLWWGDGRIAGVSGALGTTLGSPRGFRLGWAEGFVGGLILLGVVAFALRPDLIATSAVGGWALAASGLLVGAGTRLGGGCTSGHGVCGIGRGSSRSIGATVTFIAAGALTVAAMGWLS